MTAYLVLVTWPDGTEGLLFPRPGNVPLCDNQQHGEVDFNKAKHDLVAYAEQLRMQSDAKARGRFADMKGTTIRLVAFERGASICEFSL